jgi:hypothetical protein
MCPAFDRGTIPLALMGSVDRTLRRPEVSPFWRDPSPKPLPQGEGENLEPSALILMHIGRVPALTVRAQYSYPHSTGTPCCFALTSGSTWMVITSCCISARRASSMRSQIACDSATVIVPGTTR